MCMSDQLLLVVRLVLRSENVLAAARQRRRGAVLESLQQMFIVINSKCFEIEKKSLLV